jgi:hypothetical protein
MKSSISIYVSRISFSTDGLGSLPDEAGIVVPTMTAELDGSNDTLGDISGEFSFSLSLLMFS